MTQVQVIGRYTFNNTGFNVTYRYKGETTTLTLCPKATCEMLTSLNLIEGFDLDQNNEPVILFTDNTFPAGYGFDKWNSFVCTFPLSRMMVMKLMQYREDRAASQLFQETINYLLAPLQAA